MYSGTGSAWPVPQKSFLAALVAGGGDHTKTHSNPTAAARPCSRHLLRAVSCVGRGTRNTPPSTSPAGDVRLS